MEKDFFDDLLDLELNKLPWNGKQDKGTFNDGKMVGFNAGAEWAYKQLVKNNSVLDDVIKRFEIGTRVSWCKHPSPCFYVMEQKGKDVLICNTTNVEDDNYNDWWVDYKEINVL